MPALNTEGYAEGGESDSEGSAGQFKGFRKRWCDKYGEQSLLDVSECNSQTGFEGATLDMDASGKKPKLAENVEPFSVVDSTVDELVDIPVSHTSSSSRSHKLERGALLGTNLNVFKYPWEKGRLAKVFGSEPLVKIPNMRLKPGGRNPVELNVDVGLQGQMSATAVVKPALHGNPAFMQVVRKVEDVDASVDKLQKRRDALQGFWKVLSSSLCDSTIGLKVSVEATADSVNQVALQILDSSFCSEKPWDPFQALVLAASLRPVVCRHSQGELDSCVRDARVAVCAMVERQQGRSN